jgi:phosphate starvation-inducible membrane PsiE
MQFNYNNRITTKTSIKKKLLNFLLIVLALFLVLFLLSKFSFPFPKQEVNKNITNEVNKLK